jgi:hypothetical protein
MGLIVITILFFLSILAYYLVKKERKQVKIEQERLLNVGYGHLSRNELTPAIKNFIDSFQLGFFSPKQAQIISAIEETYKQAMIQVDLSILKNKICELENEIKKQGGRILHDGRINKLIAIDTSEIENAANALITPIRRFEFLTNIRSKTEKALKELPIADESIIKIPLYEILSQWKINLCNGDLDSALDSLSKCFEKDSQKSSEFFDMRLRKDLYGLSDSNQLMSIQCCRGLHWIGRTANNSYVWILHNEY